MRHRLPPTFQLIITVLLAFLAYSINGCGKDEVSYFDIPAGPANLTLKEFAAQAGTEIVFESRNIENITTNPIEGTLHHQEALRKMLSGTPCVVGKDATSGSFAVTIIQQP